MNMSELIEPIHDLKDWYMRINNEYPDPRVKRWFLMDSPFIIVLIVLSYLLFVYKLGPQFMKNREPYNLKKIQIIYNICQIVILIWMIILSTPFILKLNLLCSPVDYLNEQDALIGLELGWCYFMLKVADLIDTVFMILKKKYSQASILHVYHHALMVVMAWFFTRYYGGGHTGYIPYINSIVHVIMYSYYLISTLYTFKDIAWKKYITQIQLLQFTMIFLIYLPPATLSNCEYPKFLALSNVFLNSTMVVLFSNFYYNTYIKTKSKKL